MEDIIMRTSLKRLMILSVVSLKMKSNVLATILI